MWKKKSLAVLTAALTAAGAVTPALAQPYNSNAPYGNGGQYDRGQYGAGQYGPDDQYGPGDQNGPDDQNPNDQYGPGPDGQAGPGDQGGPDNGQYDRYDNGQYSGRYDANPPPPPGSPPGSPSGPPPTPTAGAYNNPPPPPPGYGPDYGPGSPPPGYGPPQETYGHDYDAAQDAYYRDCQQQRASNQTGGLIIGAIAGGLLGNSLSRGRGRGAGTAVGAIAGGAIGASIGNNLSCEDRGYAYNAYYAGFEAGRPHARYDWRSPRGGAYGFLEVGDYYRDRDGFRCATYTQRVWVQGRPELARGHACKQRNGAWVFVD